MQPQTNEGQPGDAKGGRPGAPVDLYRVYRALWRGKLWIVGALVLGAGLGIAAAKTMFPPSYTASATLRYQPPGEDTRGADRKEILSFVESMTAEPAVARFRELRGLPPHIDPTRWFETNPQVWGGLLTISAGGPSPQEAADTVNDMITATMDYRKELTRRASQADLEAIEARLETAKARLDEVQGQYDAFRAAKGISNLTTEQEKVINSAAETRAAADAAEGTKALLQRRLEELQERLSTTSAAPDTGPAASSSEITALRSDLARLRRSLSDDHPQVQAIRQQLARAQASLNPRTMLQQEIASVRRELDQATDEAERLQAMAQVARDRASQASAVEGEASALLAAVRVEERVVQDLDTERAKLRNQLTRADDDFRLLSPAVPPSQPESNKLKMVTRLGLPLLTTLFAVAVLLVLELWGFRVRTAAEVGFWGAGPVIGATTWPRDEHALESLIADLDDQLPNASGSMLVVGATDVEIPYVEQISRVLNEDWFSPALVDLEQPSNAPVTRFAADDTGQVALLGAGGGGTSGMPGGSSALAPRSVSNRPLSMHSSFAAPPTSQGPAASATTEASAWTEAPRGQALRRAARLADRVLVVVAAEQTSFADVAAATTRLGRTDGVGYLVIGLSDDFSSLPDRVGDFAGFFSAQRS